MSKENQTVFGEFSKKDGKVRYEVKITQAVNGYVCEVSPAIKTNKIDMKNFLGDYVDLFKGMMNNSEVDDIRNRAIKGGAIDESYFEREGIHIFKTFSELTAFMSMLFEESAYPRTAPIVAQPSGNRKREKAK